MNASRPLLASVLTAAALAAPAAAAPPEIGQDLVYRVLASHPDGGLHAGCVFRPDRWTADYGPTYVDGFAYGGGVQHTGITCRIYSWGQLAGEASADANGPVATIDSARLAPVAARPYITVCVEAWTQYVADYGQTVANCVTP
ncbi:MAG TPA: hypothetical protein VNA20_07545 [Frankiaceae bacterium]|nr:hypothetical protein [Frankiaceae bacterium]